MLKTYVCSHYGIIDAKGNAAYGELRYDSSEMKYWVVDVNDPAVARILEHNRKVEEVIAALPLIRNLSRDYRHLIP